jgi:lauroyl/myristoyl acyltransferase
MKLEQLVSGPRAIRAAMFLSQHTPEGIGHRLVWWLAGLVCQLQPAVFRVAQANLSQVLLAGAGQSSLDQVTRQVFYTAIRAYYDLYRAVRLPPDRRSAVVDVPEETRAVAQSLWNREGGAVLVFPHLGSFDLGGQAIVPYLPEMQLLTLPDPSPGLEIANELRSLSGATVTPLSLSLIHI